MRIPLAAMRGFLVVTLVSFAGAGRAQNAPPAIGPTVGPAGSAASDASASAGGLSASVGVLNPHLGGSPLWLWLDADGQGEVRLVDQQERIVWRSGMRTFNGEGELVLVPRPSDAALHLEVSDGNVPPVRRELVVTHQRAQQLSLPVLVVGGPESAALAQRMRARSPDQFIHHFLPTQLPAAPAAYLGARVVVLGPDVTLPTAQAQALRLFSCARGGVVALAPVALPVKEGCQDPPLLQGEDGAVPSAAALLQSIKNFQASLGLLDERGPMTIFGLTISDTDAAGALLARRPPWQAGVVVMLLSLVALFVVISLSRKWRPGTTVAAMAITPVVGGIALVTTGFVMAAPAQDISLTTVDARPGSRVVLVHTVEASHKRTAPDAVGRTSTAWVSQMEPTQESRKNGSALPYVTHVYDAVDVPIPLSSIPDPADPSEMVMREESKESARAESCGKTGASVDGKGLSAAHGRLLLDKCRTSRGLIAPLQPSWIPSLQLKPGEGSSAWVYLRAAERAQ